MYLRKWTSQGKTLLWIKGPLEPFSKKSHNCNWEKRLWLSENAALTQWLLGTILFCILAFKRKIYTHWRKPRGKTIKKRGQKSFIIPSPEAIHCTSATYIYIWLWHVIFSPLLHLGLFLWQPPERPPVSFTIGLMSTGNIKRRQITPWWPRVSDSSLSDLKSCYGVWFRTLTFENIISNYCDQNLFTQQTPWERPSRRKVFRIKNKRVFGECGSFCFWKKTITIIIITIPIHPVIVITMAILHCFKVREGMS